MRTATFKRLVAALFIAAMSASVYASDIVIHQLGGKFGTYYHIELELSSGMLSIPQRWSREQLFENGGQFEILINKSHFPVPAPNCKGDIILRMPWTKPSAVGAKQFIDEKIDLYRVLMDIAMGLQPRKVVVVELNPYIKIIGNQPLTIELSECNVFFRHSHGRYIAHTDPLS